MDYSDKQYLLGSQKLGTWISLENCGSSTIICGKCNGIGKMKFSHIDPHGTIWKTEYNVKDWIQY